MIAAVFVYNIVDGAATEKPLRTGSLPPATTDALRLMG
jgi:hypothetical protein